MTQTQELINWACQLQWEDIPAQTQAKAKQCLLDFFSCCLAARDEQSAQLLLKVLTKFGSEQQASVIGSSAKLSIEQAAMVNGALSHIWEIDETHRFTMSHPGDSVIATVLSVGEWLGSDGISVLTAMMAGYEVALRICHAVSPSHLEKGWHPSGTTNTFGSAVAAGRLLGLNLTQMAWAIGISVTQAAGTFCHIPEKAMTKDLNTGKAGANGILAALLASEGFTGSPTAIENEKGFIHTHADSSDLNLLTHQMGTAYKIDEIAFKPYSCCRHSHAAVDALLNLRSTYDLEPEGVSSIQVSLYPMAVYLVDDPEPFNKGFIGSRYSIQFSLALALIAGEAGMNKALFDQKYTQAMLLDPQIKAVMTKVSVKNDSELAREWPNKWPVKIKITQKDGNIYEKFIEYPLGEPENPMLDAQLVEKFNRASSGYLSPDEATELRQMIDNFEALVDVGAVLKLVSGKYQRGEV
jgi:2-methylcitrate dehydratase PrpD